MGRRCDLPRSGRGTPRSRTLPLLHGKSLSLNALKNPWLIFALIAVSALTLCCWTWVFTAAEPVGPSSEEIGASIQFGIQLVLERIEWLSTLAVALVGVTTAFVIGLHNVAPTRMERGPIALSIWLWLNSILFGMVAAAAIYGMLAQKVIPDVFAEAIARPLRAQHWALLLGVISVAIVVFTRLLAGNRSK